MFSHKCVVKSPMQSRAAILKMIYGWLLRNKGEPYTNGDRYERRSQRVAEADIADQELQDLLESASGGTRRFLLRQSGASGCLWSG